MGAGESAATVPRRIKTTPTRSIHLTSFMLLCLAALRKPSTCTKVKRYCTLSYLQSNIAEFKYHPNVLEDAHEIHNALEDVHILPNALEDVYILPNALEDV